MKIAWLHSHFLYWMGGTKFVYEVSTRLAQENSLTIFVERSSTFAEKKYSSSGIQIFEIGGRSSNNFIYWLLFPYYIRKDLTNLKTRIADYDVVVSSMFPMNWIAGQLNKPTVQYCFEPFAFFHDRIMISGLPLFKRTLLILLGWLYRNMDIEATRESDRLLTLNTTTATWISEVYGRCPEITFAGVDTTFFYKRNISRLSDAYQDKKVVVHCTDYSPIKGTNLVIKAFAQVKKVVPEARLLITHTVYNKSAQRRLSALSDSLGVLDSIDFLGFVDIERLAEYYTLADVLVAAGRGMSLPVQEAMACETPAIRHESTKDEIVHGESGFLVNPEDTPAFADAIVTILRNPMLGRQMGLKGRETILKLYNWERVAELVSKAIAGAYHQKEQQRTKC